MLLKTDLRTSKDPIKSRKRSIQMSSKSSNSILDIGDSNMRSRLWGICVRPIGVKQTSRLNSMEFAQFTRRKFLGFSK